MTSPHEPVVPSENFKGRSGINPIADFVMETDWAAGQVIEAVDLAGISEKTIIIFTSDNGHSHYTGLEELIDAGHYPSGEYRGHKSDVWEGSHRVPYLVRWPGKVEAGSESHHIIGLGDTFATVAEILGQELPYTAAEDSLSFHDLLVRNASTPSRHQIVVQSTHGEFPAFLGAMENCVFRNQGVLDESRGKPTQIELYNLDRDISETTNIATGIQEVSGDLPKIWRQSSIEEPVIRPGPVKRHLHQYPSHPNRTLGARALTFPKESFLSRVTKNSLFSHPGSNSHTYFLTNIHGGGKPS